MKTLLQPRSTLQLVLAGFILVCTPLILAVIVAVVQVDKLAHESKQAILDAEIAAIASQSLVQYLTEMERTLAQYNVLQDDAFYKAYVEKHLVFQDATQQLQNLDLDKALQQRINRLAKEENQLFDKSGNNAIVSHFDIANAFAPLATQARHIQTACGQLAEIEATNTRQAAAQVQGTLLSLASTVIPMAVVLAAIFTILIARPLKQMDRAIHKMGAGDFDESVGISGPRDLQELGQRLNWLRLRILELEKQKLSFLRHMSHELKTPLTTIREATELLSDDSGRHRGRDEQEIINIMRDSSLQLQQLIENLLDFGKTSSYAVADNHLQAVNLPAIIETLANKHRLPLASKGLTVDKQLSTIVVQGNADRLRVVVDNLLSNAIKYAPENSHIKICLSSVNGQAVLDIQDQGPGFRADEVPQVLEPFYQGAATPQGPVKGTGLGLAIAKEHIEAQHGSIDIIPGAGGHVRITLPLGQASNEESAERENLNEK